jgi:hypothetical protein
LTPLGRLSKLPIELSEAALRVEPERFLLPDRSHPSIPGSNIALSDNADGVHKLVRAFYLLALDARVGRRQLKLSWRRRRSRFVGLEESE